jgi:hypothetical protein
MPTKPKPLAWHGNPQLRETTVRRMRQHRDADELIQEAYRITDANTLSGFRGCFIGCLLPNDHRPEPDQSSTWRWHIPASEMYGIPVNVLEAVEAIFEGIDESDAPQFAVDVVEAIAVGADLSKVSYLCEYLDEGDPLDEWAERVLDALKDAQPSAVA